uniref:Uncharacterized protein n=1 Tax=Tetranychus urticae TaxID=32264 RepID=T1K0L4_TETUR
MRTKDRKTVLLLNSLSSFTGPKRDGPTQPKHSLGGDQKVSQNGLNPNPKRTKLC